MDVDLPRECSGQQVIAPEEQPGRVVVGEEHRYDQEHAPEEFVPRAEQSNSVEEEEQQVVEHCGYGAHQDWSFEDVQAGHHGGQLGALVLE